MPPRTRSWRLLAVVGAAALLVLAGGLGVHTYRARQAAAAARTPACTVSALQVVGLGRDDRATLLPSGQLVVARGGSNGIKLERETPEGLVPFTDSPLVLGVLGSVGRNYRDLRLHSVNLATGPWVVLDLDQSDLLGSFVLGIAEKRYFGQRVRAPVTSIAVDSVGGRLVLGVTTLEVDDPSTGVSPGAEVYITAGEGARPVNVEVGGAYAASVASLGNRIAFSYLIEKQGHVELHLALLDEHGERQGDIHVIRSLAKHPAPTVAFARTSAVVYWIDDSTPKTRLTMSTYSLGDPEPSLPKAAIEDATLTERPVTARLPSGEWVVAWLASNGNAPTLRVAPVLPGGVLDAPTDVAVAPSFTHLTASSGDHGAELSWKEITASGEITQKFARVVRTPPR